MNLSHLETFLHVAKTLSFSQTAEKMAVSRGLVSRHIKALEGELQCVLFHRTTRSVALTEAGTALYDTASQIENLTLKAAKNIRDLSHEDKGSIHFTVPTTLGPALCKSLLSEFIGAHPKIKVVLNFTAQIKDIEFGEFDVALRSVVTPPDNLVAKPLGQMKNILVSSPQWLNRHPITSPDDLNHVECLQSALNPQWNDWALLSTKGEKALIKTQGNLSSSDYNGMVALAESGLGVAYLPLPIVETLLAEKKLLRVLPDWSGSQHNFFMLYAFQRYYPTKLKSFITAIVTWREAHPHWFL